MVLPPQYEEMRRARAEETPRAFHEVLSSEGLMDRYELRRVDPPARPPGWCGPVARPSFEVWSTGPRGVLVARLQPDGTSELMDKGFGLLWEGMLAMIERAGQKAHDEFLAEYAQLREKKD